MPYWTTFTLDNVPSISNGRGMTIQLVISLAVREIVGTGTDMLESVIISHEQLRVLLIIFFKMFS